MDKYLSKKINIISLLSMIMVVYGHSYNLSNKYVVKNGSITANSFIQQFVSQGLVRIVIPIFFAISGYLFFITFNPTIEGVKKKFISRFKSLFIPLVIWNIAGIIFIYIVQNFSALHVFISQGMIKDYSIMQILDSIFIKPKLYQFWFIIDLIKYVIISPIIYYLVKKWNIYILTILFLGWFFNINLYLFNNEGILSFTFGASLAVNKYTIKKQENKKVSSCMLILWLVILIIKTFVEFKFNINSNILYKISILIGTIAVWYCYDTWNIDKFNIKIINKLLPFTFFIFAAHEPTLTIIKKILFKLPIFLENSSLIVYIIAPIITIILVVIIGYMIRKYMRGLYNIIVGGR